MIRIVSPNAMIVTTEICLRMLMKLPAVKKLSSISEQTTIMTIRIKMPEYFPKLTRLFCVFICKASDCISHNSFL